MSDSSLLNFSAPIIHKLNDIEDIQLSDEPEPFYSSLIAFPKTFYGFQHFSHASQDKLEILDQFKGKKQVYLVTNQLETTVENAKNDIDSFAKKYFKNTPMNNQFYEMWEILCLLNIVPIEERGYVSLHLGTEDGSFAQAVMYFREQFGKSQNVKNDMHMVVGKSKLKNSKINELESPSKKGADLITYQYNTNFKYRNTKEQESMQQLVNGLIDVCKFQNKKGNCVLQLYETYTDPMIKLLTLFSSAYGKSYIIKPGVSKSFQPDRYLVLLGFKGNRKKLIDHLEKIRKGFRNGKFLIDIYPSYKVPSNFKKTVIKMNTDISNRQFISVNKIVTFIENQNFHGDDYKSKNKEQIVANEYWIKTFLVDGKDLKKARVN